MQGLGIMCPYCLSTSMYMDALMDACMRGRANKDKIVPRSWIMSIHVDKLILLHIVSQIELQRMDFVPIPIGPNGAGTMVDKSCT